MTQSDFASLSIESALIKNLASLGYTGMTPIQAASLPPILDGRDVIAKAKTGSGKTAAFGIGLLSKLHIRLFRVQGLVLCPTRELAGQVGRELRRLARFTHNIKVLSLCGGVPIGPQFTSLAHGAHIVVGTPGRILDHLRRGSLRLDRLRVLVLDEADRMLDMGFSEDIAEVIASAPQRRQTLLFSATYADSIIDVSRKVQNNPLEVSVSAVHDNTQIEQLIYTVAAMERLEGLARVLSHHGPESALVFCNTKRDCDEVADGLTDLGFSALAIHGDLEQWDRDGVMVRFANGSCRILVATDVAARGLDIEDIGAVVNYELSKDPEVHIHRIGRTGRAGRKGLALSMVAPGEEYRAAAVDRFFDAPVKREAIDALPAAAGQSRQPAMVTLCIHGGRKNKLRPGDILGALTGKKGIAGGEVGKIDISDFHAYVAIKRPSADTAMARLEKEGIKGRHFRVRRFE